MDVAPAPGPKTAVVATIALATTTATVLGTALHGTPTELGIALLALTIVVAVMWRWSQ